jgi:hypothetical protein
MVFHHQARPKLSPFPVPFFGVNSSLLGFTEFLWTDGCGGRRRRRQFIDKHRGQRGSRTGPETGQADRPGPAGSGPFSLPDAYRSIVDLLSSACGPLTSSFPRFRWSSLSCKLQHLPFRSPEFCAFMLWS